MGETVFYFFTYAGKAASVQGLKGQAAPFAEGRNKAHAAADATP